MWLILTPFPSIETQKKREEKYRFWTILTAGWNEFKIYTLYKTRTVYLRWSIKIKSFRPILAQTLCFRIRCTLCLALLWSFRKPKFTHLQCECIESVRVCVCCICTLAEAVHLIQGAVALATVHLQIDSDEKTYCLFSLLSILSLLKTINTTILSFHDLLSYFWSITLQYWNAVFLPFWTPLHSFPP